MQCEHTQSEEEEVVITDSNGHKDSLTVVGVRRVVVVCFRNLATVDTKTEGNFPCLRLASTML